MPSDPPSKLRPYLFHGLELSWGSKEAEGNCPMCSREERFNVNLSTGQYHCFKCGSKGNVSTFLRWLWEESDSTTKDYSGIQQDRGLLYPETLMQWGVAKSALLDRWLVPGYGVDGKLRQLYKYARVKGRMRLLATPTLGHQLFGTSPELFSKRKSTVYICEGPWDAMALYEVLEHTKETEKGYRSTASRDHNMLADANVIAVPGCESFAESWSPLLANREVVLMYDSDHPREDQKGKISPPAGMMGMKRVAGILSGSKKPPAEIHCLQWGESWYDPLLPSGYDLRDHLT